MGKKLAPTTPAKITRMMKDHPKDFVEGIIHGDSFFHRRKLREKRGPKRPFATGFPSDMPREDDYDDESSYEDAVAQWEAVNYVNAYTAENAPQKWERPPPLVEKRNRTRRNLKHKLVTLKTNPKLLITLSIDRKQYRDIDVDLFESIFAKFKRYLRDDYPDGWFIWKIEWDNEAGLHVHILGDTGRTRTDITRLVVKQTWNLYCKHENPEFKSVDIQRVYDIEGAKGYFLKKSKRDNELTCILKLDGRDMYGTINAKKIEYYKVKPISLSTFEHRMFYKYYTNKMRKMKEKKDFSYYDRTFLKDFGPSGFIPNELLERAYALILKVRSKIFGTEYPESHEHMPFSKNQYRAYKLLKKQLSQ